MPMKKSEHEDMCEWCGEHIPMGVDIFETDEGNIYCSEDCRDQAGDFDWEDE